MYLEKVKISRDFHFKTNKLIFKSQRVTYALVFYEKIDQLECVYKTATLHEKPVGQ